MSTPANQLPGQAPAADPAQAANPAAAPAAPATPPAQVAGDPQQPAQPAAPAAPQAGTQITDVATLQKLLNDARADAAAQRTKVKGFEDAQKSETQKLQEQNAELAKQNRLMSVQVAATKLSIVDPEAAAALLPADTPLEQIETKLTEMLAVRPWLKGQAQTAPPVNTPLGGNPPSQRGF
jgi:hypothetical protein